MLSWLTSILLLLLLKGDNWNQGYLTELVLGELLVELLEGATLDVGQQDYQVFGTTP